MNAIFTLSLRIDNPHRLLQAALAHPDAQGMDRAEFVDEDGDVDISACLGILLDPGALPGCSLGNHEVEVV